MYAPSSRRGLHRKRLSALRLSSDSNVTTLPVYTSPPRHNLPDIPSEQPPAYPDSAEEADEDTDPSDSESAALYAPSPPPSLPVSPRRARRSRGSSRSIHRRQQSIAASASDPYLDSLLERSVHALEMSNALLQSSMSTQSSLTAVLADDSVADRHLEERAQRLTNRIRSSRDTHTSWMDELEEISRGVEGLVRAEESSEDDDRLPPDASISQSLPTSSLAEHMQQARQRRRASQDFRQHHPSRSTSNLQLSVHDRSHFVSPPPRAITMYVDSSEAADLIALPATLGVRPSSQPPPTPLPNQSSPIPPSAEVQITPASVPTEPQNRAAEMLASYVMPRSAPSASPPTTSLRRRSSSSSANTVKRPRLSKSPPPPLRLEGSTTNSSPAATLRSRSTTPIRGSPAIRQARPLTPPIEELSTSSASSESATLHVDRTVESLRQILEKQKARSVSAPVPPPPRPSLLAPPTVAPVSGTSNATASISRLFTKPRHTTSTRAASPPKQSSMKGRSAPSTPISATMPSPSPSLLSVPDFFGLGLGGRTRTLSGGSSGASTPKRISFAEPAESYSSTKPEGASAQFRHTKSRSRARKDRDGKGKGKGVGMGKGKGRAANDEDEQSEDGRGGWWTSWLLGPAAVDGGLGAGGSRGQVDRLGYANARAVAGGTTWAMRPGFGGGLDEWGA